MNSKSPFPLNSCAAVFGAGGALFLMEKRMKGHAATVWAAALAIGISVAAVDVQAATLAVTTHADSGAGSLRAALAAAASGDTIDATGISGVISLTTSDLLVSNSITILGPGPAILAVDGNAASRVFHITNGVTVVISGLTITNGAVSGSFPGHVGGGIWNDHSTLTLSNCAIINNSGGDGPGGGIYNDGGNGSAALIAIASSISGNSVTNNGGGIESYGYNGSSMISLIACTVSSNTASGNATVGGGIFNNGNSGSATLSVSNCTFSGNAANENGGAIYNTSSPGVSANLTLIACTFSGNSVSTPGGSGGIFVGGSFAKLEIGDTILKAGVSGGNVGINGGKVITDGYNLVSDGGLGLFTNTTDRVNTDPLLAPLANNGGPTLTCAPLSNSPAIDQGESFALTTDQRGAPRPFLFSLPNPAGGDGSDIGAFELGSAYLGAAMGSNGMVLSWPAYYGDFTLQSATNLQSSSNWSDVPDTPVVVGNQLIITTPATNSMMFYRLTTH